jgi:hypothetical protein
VTVSIIKLLNLGTSTFPCDWMWNWLRSTLLTVCSILFSFVLADICSFHFLDDHFNRFYLISLSTRIHIQTNKKKLLYSGTILCQSLKEQQFYSEIKEYSSYVWQKVIRYTVKVFFFVGINFRGLVKNYKFVDL